MTEAQPASPHDGSGHERLLPRLIHCEEQGPVDVPLELVMDASGRLDVNPDVAGRDFFAVSVRKRALTLRARAFVGFIPLNDRVVVHVRPRVPVRTLARLIEVSGTPATPLTSLRTYEISEEWSDSLLDLYASALVHHVDAIAAGGFLRDYVRREAVSSFPRGRLMTHRTVTSLQARGIRHAAHAAWFERTADIPANRAIKYAIWLLAQRYVALGSTERAARRLHHALSARYGAFDGVTLDHGHAFLRDELVRGTRQLPSLRGYYRDALDLARAVIEQRGVAIERTGEGALLPSLVVDMGSVLEGYVRNVLALHADEAGWRTAVLDGNVEGQGDLFDAAPSPRATPDVVLRAPDGSTPVVIEVKNVPVKEAFSGRDAMNQAIAYAASYRARHALLVHPRASAYQEDGMRRLGSLGGIEVWQYRFDLAADDLAAEGARFGEAVGALLADGEQTAG